MRSRIGIALLAALAMTACDTGLRELKPDETAALLPDNAPRTGVVTVDGEAYPFDVRTCAIGGTKARRTFLIVGEGVGPNGERYAVNADGSYTAVSVVLRKHSALSIPAQVFRSRFDLEHVRVERQTVTGRGEFRSNAGNGPFTGSFAASCG